VRWNYSMLHQCRFFETQCRITATVMVVTVYIIAEHSWFNRICQLAPMGHLIPGSLGPYHSTPKRQLDQFRQFLRGTLMWLTHTHTHRQTDTQTDQATYGTYIESACIQHCFQCWWCWLKTLCANSTNYKYFIEINIFTNHHTPVCK